MVNRWPYMAGASLPRISEVTTEDVRHLSQLAIGVGILLTWFAAMHVRYDIAGTVWQAIFACEVCAFLIGVGMMWRWNILMYIGAICLVGIATHFGSLVDLGRMAFGFSLGIVFVTLGLYRLYRLH